MTLIPQQLLPVGVGGVTPYYICMQAPELAEVPEDGHKSKKPRHSLPEADR